MKDGLRTVAGFMRKIGAQLLVATAVVAWGVPALLAWIFPLFRSDKMDGQMYLINLLMWESIALILLSLSTVIYAITQTNTE